MSREVGNISIHTENILPIIKKWLYSDKDIFVRELVSNANDAISKFKKLVTLGEAQATPEEKYQIKIIVDKEQKTIQFIDNGIGMTDEEVKKYINQIAFSGAEDFLAKYKDKTEDGNQIIGHFGLGFYSAFMVAQKVQIDTLSYVEGAKAVRWTSEGKTDFEMDDSEHANRGTSITLFVSEEGNEFLDEFKMRETLLKYCSFLPYEIYLEDANKKIEPPSDEIEELKAEGDEDAENIEETAKNNQEPKPLNDTHPLWIKNPKDCTDEEYKDFYRKVFHDFNEPLFWIHLNMDYPFNLKGILFFPKLKHEFEMNEGQIKLYYNQVFVADNIKEVIPEFLMLLKGVIDCPDLPLNVSRSFLQNDGYVSKLSNHITKKVGDKLISIFENERESFNQYWDDIHPFVKYGCIKEQKFHDRIKDILIFKTTNNDYVTLKEYLERNKEKHENKVFYVSDDKQQAQYIKLFKEHDMEAVNLSSMIDNHFIQFLESKETTVKFSRVDSDISDSMKSEAPKDEALEKESKETLEKLFKEALQNEQLKLQIESLKSQSIPAMILLSEQSRRMQEMSKMFGGMDMSHMFPKEETLVLNQSNKLVQALKMMSGEEQKEDSHMICQHLYDLAMLSHKTLEPEAMTRFVERSNLILGKLAGIA